MFLKYFVFLIFIISVAFAAGSIVLSSRLRSRYRSDIFSPLLYYQVFIFTFGFYGIWGQVLIRAFLTPLISAELLGKFTDISLLLGLPFLVFAWMMFMIFSTIISGRKSNKWFVFFFLLFNFSVLVVLGFFIIKRGSFNNIVNLKYYFISMNLVYTFLSAFLIHFPGKGHGIIHDRDRRVIAPVIFLVMIIQGVPLLFDTGKLLPGLIFVFTFFAGNAFLPVYLTYFASLSPNETEPVDESSYGTFCRKYDISPRESEIIIEICNGLSNKEISEKLFISLQTVKDHTHRIYTKTGVRSRVQLINLVKGVYSPDLNPDED